MAAKKAVKALVIKEGRLLVLFKGSAEDVTPSTWDLPGGRVSKGEAPEDAVKREVLEETGVVVSIGNKVAEWEGSPQKGLTLHVHFYKCDYAGGELRVSGEHEHGKWMTLQEMGESNLPVWIKEKAGLVL